MSQMTFSGPNKRTAITWLACLVLTFSTACGVFQVGLEDLPQREIITPSATPPPPTITAAPTRQPDFDSLEAGLNVRLTTIHMLDKITGWGIGQIEGKLGDYLLFTRDAGRTWYNRTPRAVFQAAMPEGTRITAFFGPNGSAWALFTNPAPETSLPTQAVIWRTTDFGYTWQAGAPLPVDGMMAEHFVPAHLGFLDDQYGWMMAHLGAGMSHDYIAVFITTDGGQTWQRILDPEQTPNLMACAKTGLWFTDPQTGWLSGDCPGLMPGLFLYSTRDGGQTWQAVNLPVPPNQPADLFNGEKMGCGVPELIHYSPQRVLFPVRCLAYSDGKPSAWLYISQPDNTFSATALPLPYGSLHFINAQEGWFVGSTSSDPTVSGEIYRTVDGGLSWTLILATGWQGTPHFVDADIGWVIARAGEKVAFVYTMNGGLLWSEINPVTASE
ncbi:MAG: hypothetical protein DDG60_02005 [Anaerolineae bacterium]|nr:MAG: hypothetical protein DDG60_02005 [Anaerolineae bacterium]